MDNDGSNNITLREFQEGLEMSGVDPVPCEADLRAIFKSIDVDHSRGISFKEFQKALDTGTPASNKPKPVPKPVAVAVQTPPHVAPVLKRSPVVEIQATPEPPPQRDTWRESVQTALRTASIPFGETMSPSLPLSVDEAAERALDSIVSFEAQVRSPYPDNTETNRLEETVQENAARIEALEEAGQSWRRRAALQFQSFKADFESESPYGPSLDLAQDGDDQVGDGAASAIDK